MKNTCAQNVNSVDVETHPGIQDLIIKPFPFFFLFPVSLMVGNSSMSTKKAARDSEGDETQGHTL